MPASGRHGSIAQVHMIAVQYEQVLRHAFDHIRKIQSASAGFPRKNSTIFLKHGVDTRVACTLSLGKSSAAIQVFMKFSCMRFP